MLWHALDILGKQYMDKLQNVIWILEFHNGDISLKIALLLRNGDGTANACNSA